ncbi:MAG: RidA family protein [Capnocytophaga sp.]|jgi:putative endoribonuclease L-PSP|uniref:RidA family protein n=1 Tax=Capnocytophaga sp. oral taxon 863 TaxID=1227265 RepID=UPI0003969C02|nr:RidA family protein [Capnocytophaga sp. oral taxon 863]ERI64569.1 putative endoribonuclease L-PSP [Capnocytophaga sp. oral taxon 863 str. F0517]RKW13798.1 MAG: RidA family protein [Capnocytophaga sp.]
MKKVILSSKAPAPIGPYSQAIEANGTLYVSGQIPIDPATGEVVAGGIEPQAKQVMQSLQAILQEAGYSFDQVVKTTILLDDLANFAKVNEIYGSYFGEGAPARETYQVAKLPKGVAVEISCIAVK